MTHYCESCGEEAFVSVAVYEEGEERFWFCEKCAAT